MSKQILYILQYFWLIRLVGMVMHYTFCYTIRDATHKYNRHISKATVFNHT